MLSLGFLLSWTYPCQALYIGDIKLELNSKNVKKNCSVVRKLLGDLVEAGHIEKVNFKPLVISPLNLVPKSNSSPRLIHNLKALNRFVKKKSVR